MISHISGANGKATVDVGASEAKNARLEQNGSSENSLASESDLTQLEEQRRRILDQLNSTQAEEEEEEEMEEVGEEEEEEDEEDEKNEKEEENGEQNEAANGIDASKQLNRAQSAV